MHYGAYFSMLDPSQQAFVLAYCGTMNTAKASRAASISPSTGSKWLKVPEILGAIEQKIAERNQRLEIDADWVLTELKQLYEADVADLYHKEGHLRNIHDWPEHWRRHTVSVRSRTDQFGSLITDVKMPDKTKIIELIGKHVGVRAFAEQVINSTEENLAARLSKGRKRMNELKRKRGERVEDEGETEIKSVPKPKSPGVSFL